MGSQRFSKFSVFSAAFILSVDYSVVMPSVWLFLLSLDENVGEYFLGLVIGAFNLGGLIVQPIFGKWLDKRPIREGTGRIL